MTHNHYVALTHRAAFQVAGEDATTFLQGLVSNDMLKAARGQAIYALMLTPQGKYLYDFFIIQQAPNCYWLDCSRAKLPAILKKMTMYKLRSKVTITDMSADHEVLALLESAPDSSGISYADPRSNMLFSRAIAPSGSIKPESTLADYETIRIAAGVPDGDADMQEGEDFPLDFAMDKWNAVDYKKGCYVGQEVTARVHHRGTLRKGVYKVKGQGALPARSTTIVAADGSKLGEMLSSCGNMGLALLRHEETQKANLQGKAGDVAIAIEVIA